MASTICATHTAPSNIAVIKYWGKADVALNTPINSSVSVTMDQDDLKAITTVVASPAFTADRLWLNGVCVDWRRAARRDSWRVFALYADGPARQRRRAGHRNDPRRRQRGSRGGGGGAQLYAHRPERHQLQDVDEHVPGRVPCTRGHASRRR